MSKVNEVTFPLKQLWKMKDILTHITVLKSLKSILRSL